MRRHLGLAAALLLSGCVLFGKKDTGPPMPPHLLPGAPYGYRQVHYGNARAVRVDRDYLGFSLQRSSHSDWYLVLGNGRKVFDVNDLAPYIAPETELGRTIAERKRASARERRIYMIGGGGVALGAAFFLLGALMLDDHQVPGGISVGLGAAGLFGGMGYWLFAPRLDPPPADIDGKMLERYNRSLEQTLRICVDGLAIREC